MIMWVDSGRCEQNVVRTLDINFKMIDFLSSLSGFTLLTTYVKWQSVMVERVASNGKEFGAQLGWTRLSLKQCNFHCLVGILTFWGLVIKFLAIKNCRFCFRAKSRQYSKIMMMTYYKYMPKISLGDVRIWTCLNSFLERVVWLATFAWEPGM